MTANISSTERRDESASSLCRDGSTPVTERIHNLRDVGGLRVRSGQYLSRGRLFRSGEHGNATDSDLRALERLGVRTIIDLRSRSEREERPSRPLPACRTMVCEDYLDAQGPSSAAEEKFGEDDAVRYMTASYAGMLFQRPIRDGIRLYLVAVADNDGPTLVHCASGKDRTGLAVAILLSLIGVDRVDIMADYLLSNAETNVAAQIESVGPRVQARFAQPMTEAALRAILSVRPEYLMAALNAVDERSGSVARYVEHELGLDRAFASSLTDKLLDKSGAGASTLGSAFL